MAAHPALLRRFGEYEGRKSRVFTDAALIGSRRRAVCALVTPQDDFVLVHVCPCFAETVDKIGEEVFDVAEEYRLNNWEILTERFLPFLHWPPEELCRLASRSREHRLV